MVRSRVAICGGLAADRPSCPAERYLTTNDVRKDPAEPHEITTRVPSVSLPLRLGAKTTTSVPRPRPVRWVASSAA
jgi:hypothetical protein